jgi:hypothetical protein
MENLKEIYYFGDVWVILNWGLPKCDVDWIHLAHDTEQWRALVYVVGNMSIP